MLDVTPLAIGPKNAEQMTGHSWRWLRDHAAELGVEVLRVGGKPVILAAPLLAALEARAGGEEVDELEAEPTDELAEMRARIARAG